MKDSVLILCTGNSVQSQMAEGLLRHDADEAFEVESAGTKPSIVRPEAIAGRLLEFLTFHIRRHHAQIQLMMKAYDFPQA